MNKAQEQVVLITGASSGMGRAFTRALLQQGALVYAVARRLEAMNELKILGARTLKMDINGHQPI